MKTSFHAHFFFAIVIGLTSAGCALFDRPNTTSQVTGPEVRDVPQAARDTGVLRHRLLVLPFLSEKADRSSTLGEEARRVVVRELMKTGQFVIVSPEDFTSDLKKYITPEGDYDLTAISRLAASMGVAAVLEGKILDLRARRVGDSVGIIREIKAQVESDVRLRMFAGKNGKEILNEVRSSKIESSSTRIAERAMSDRFLAEDPTLVRQSVRSAVYAAIPQIIKAVEKLSWEGRVAMISGERVYLNAGRLSGLQIGDILKVLEDGEEVYDPETGRFIGKAPGRMKGTVEVVSYFGKDGAIGVVHSGSGFKENDLVELY